MPATAAITLPADEQSLFLKTIASVGADISKSNPQLAAAYKIVTDAAARAAQQTANNR
jgi:hypothetical protein